MPVVHVIAHDGSASAQEAYERVRTATEEVLVVYRDVAPPPGELVDLDTIVPALTMDRILRTARAAGAPWVTLPSSLFSAEHVLLGSIDAMTRMATDSWPAVVVQSLRRPSRATVDEVVVVATHGRSSGSLLLVATIVALLYGARLTKLVVGGTDDERVRPGSRAADADLASRLRDTYALPTRYRRLPRAASAVTLERTLAAIPAELLVVGLGDMHPGVTHRDLTRAGRRRLLTGPLRVESVALRSTSADVLVVSDAARLRRRVARTDTEAGLGVEYWVGDRERFDAFVRSGAQLTNQAAELGSS